MKTQAKKNSSGSFVAEKKSVSANVSFSKDALNRFPKVNSERESYLRKIGSIALSKVASS